MKQTTAYKILDIQEAMKIDGSYKPLFAEYRCKNDRFLKCLKTLPQEQADTVMDYIGVLTELHMLTLEYAIR